MIYSEDIDNLLSGEELCFNNDYVVIECEIEHNTWISTYVKISIDYKYRESDDWKTLKVSIPWNYRPTFKKEIIKVPTSNTGAIYLKNLTSSGWFKDISITGKNIEIDDMTAQELLSQIEALRTELERLRNSIPTMPNMNNYVTNEQLAANNYLTEHQDLSTYVSKNELSNCGYITIGDVPTIDTSTYATIQYVDNKFDSIDITDGTINLNNFVSKQELSSCSYITLNDIPQPNLTDFVSKTELSNCSYITLNDIPAGTGNYDDTEIRADISNLEETLNKYITGPAVELISQTISYEEFNTPLSNLFYVNDLFEYRFSRPNLITTYNPNIWVDNPYPEYDSRDNTYTFKENIDIINLDYKITAYCDSSNYQQDFILTQLCTDRIYFPQGTTLTLDSYNQRNINLTTYIVTNLSNYTIIGDFISMPNLGSVLVQSNANSLSTRGATITIRGNDNDEYDFYIIQPGNPDYDPNSGGNEPELEPVEYTMPISTLADGQISNDDILITLDKASGSNSPIWHNASSAIRIYAKNTITITSEYTISKIEFTLTSDTSATITSNLPSLNNITNNTQIWEGFGNEIVFTVSDTGQYRVTSLKVTILQ